ncbi:hypothetical protein VNI00_017911 [Paramarasmius palmivorus]|uniref:Uncharacterized protein n=1 Tax=Paramarasmius palmivorus TaxID=297713 RepID=A0AAW0B279_9AGAR
MSFHRLKGAALRYTYAVTWHVQDFVWRHPCFEGSQDPLELPGVSEDGSVLHIEAAGGESGGSVEPDSVSSVGIVLDNVLQQADETLQDVEESDEGDSGSSESSDLDSVDSTSSAHWELWKYRCGYGVCTHAEYRPPLTLDASILDYLEGLYPLMEREHDSKRDVVYMQDAFESLYRSGMVGSARYPSGHVVSMIHQCLEDVDLTCVCDDPKISLQFMLDEDGCKVVTVCTILIPIDLLASLRAELRGWSYSEMEMMESGLVVLLGGVA